MRLPAIAIKCAARLRPVLAAVAFGLGIVSLHVGGHLDFLDSQFADTRFQLVRSSPSPQIAIIAIDAQSLNERPVGPGRDPGMRRWWTG